MKDATDESPRQKIITAARQLFNDRGFHSTPMSELAAVAGVSVGQIYRMFPGKDDIIVAIVKGNVEEAAALVEDIFASVSSGGLSVFEGIKTIAYASITKACSGLDFEILAETYRNPRVAESLASFIGRYRDGVRRLAMLVRPNVGNDELNAYEEIMIACFFGLGHRALISPTLNAECASHETARLILRALTADDRGS